MFNLEELELPQNIVKILEKEDYTHTYKDIKELEKNKKIEVKFTCEKQRFDKVDYAVFDVYYKLSNKLSFFKQSQWDLNYKRLGKIYLKWNDVF